MRIIELLLTANPSGVFTRDHQGGTPLHLISSCGGEKATELFLLAGSVCDALCASTNWTPLTYAISRIQEDDFSYKVVTLLDFGARVENVRDIEIPKWIVSFSQRRDARRTICNTLLHLRRKRSRVIQRNGRDVLRLVAQHMWSRRRIFEK